MDFIWVSKVIRHWFGFILRSSVIGLNLALPYSTNQIQNQTQSRLGHVRFPALGACFHWFVVFFTFVVIGRWDCFGFSLMTLNENCFTSKLLPTANWNNFQLCCSLFWICSTLSWTRATKIRKEAQRTWRKYHGRNLKPTKKNKVKRNKTTVVRW